MLHNLSLRAILYDAVLHLGNKFDLIWFHWFKLREILRCSSAVFTARRYASFRPVGLSVTLVHAWYRTA